MTNKVKYGNVNVKVFLLFNARFLRYYAHNMLNIPPLNLTFEEFYLFVFVSIEI